MIEGIFVEGLVYGVMCLGVFLTFRVLRFPDLTVDGTFPLGASLMAGLLVAGLPEGLIIIICFAGGMAAGAVTALLHNHLRIPPLLAGILTMTMLWSLNIRVMGGRPNLPLLQQETTLDVVRDSAWIFNSQLSLLFFFIIAVLLIKVLLDLLFHTGAGVAMKALGNNPQMIISQGINPGVVKLLGVSLSNGLVALAGGFAAQYQGFSDVSLGNGIIVSGLASVMIGEFLFKSRNIIVQTLFVILGSILYRAIMYLGRYYGYYINLTPSDLKLITGLLVILALVLPAVRKRNHSDAHLQGGI